MAENLPLYSKTNESSLIPTTVILLVIFLPLKVAVIVALPLETAVTKPSSETVATLLLLDFQLVVLFAPQRVSLLVLPWC